jgi:hypothetical protein
MSHPDNGDSKKHLMKIVTTLPRDKSKDTVLGYVSGSVDDNSVLVGLRVALFRGIVGLMGVLSSPRTLL